MSKSFGVGCACLAVVFAGCRFSGGQSGTDGAEVMGSPSTPPDAGPVTPPEPTSPTAEAGAPANTSSPDAGPPASEGGVAPLSNEPSPWLGFCGGECAPGLSCVCGVCTEQCEATEDCSALHPNAQCSEHQPADPEACYSAVSTQVCDLSCGSDQDCSALSAQHVCSWGRCRAPATSWLESLCEEPTFEPAPTCDINELLRPTDYCLGVECVRQNECDQPPLVGALDCSVQPRLQFNPTLGRCEHVERCGGYGSFETIEACWETCGGLGECWEDWQPLTGTSQVLAVDAAAARQALTRSWSSTVRFPDGSTSTLTLELANVELFDVVRQPNPNWGLERVQNCPNLLVAEASARLISEDGQLDESWQRVRLEIVSETEANARVQVVVPEHGGNPADGPRLNGSYEPEPDPEHCLAGSALSFSVAGDDFSGEVYHTRATRPCGDPLAAITSDGSETPNGPVW